MYKWLVIKLTLGFILSAGIIYCQENTFEFSGHILSEISGKPVSLVGVFISGTSTGTVSNESGYYKIDIPYYPCKVVFSHVGFKTLTMDLKQETEEKNIFIVPREIPIDEVVITAKGRRKQNLRMFYKHFIGQGNKKRYIVNNDSVLIFERDAFSFRAMTQIPLEITNLELGYNISILLDEFELNNRAYPNGPMLALDSPEGVFVSHIYGLYYYEELNIESEARMEEIQRNRLDHYYGSYRHFLKALYDDDLLGEGYVFTVFPNDSLHSGFIPIGQRQSYYETRKYMMDADSIQIVYVSRSTGKPINLEDHKMKIEEDIDNLRSIPGAVFHVSSLLPGRGQLLIRYNGTTPNANFSIIGEMSKKSLVNTLPEDFAPGK